MNQETQDDGEAINKIFVYGTLRPDIKAPWSAQVYNNEKFKLKTSRAYIPFTNLQLFRYNKYTNIRIDKKWLFETDIVHGDILESSNIEETLCLFDRIEDCPSLYSRIATNVFNVDEQKYEKVYVYLITEKHSIMKSAFECVYNDVKLILDV
jgi:gamma-glutamylcyclotransferase (GGCT)/AIG2-like uncharacterized protein YtfP